MAVFNLHNPRENYRPRFHARATDRRISAPISLATNCKRAMSFCRRSVVRLWTIIKETAENKGVHDVHNRMCNRYLYEAMLGSGLSRRLSGIISEAVAPYGITPEDLPDTFRTYFNMNLSLHDCSKHFSGLVSSFAKRVGDYVEFRAEMDCLVAISICTDGILVQCQCRASQLR